MTKMTKRLRDGLDDLGIPWIALDQHETDDVIHEITHFKSKDGYTNSAVYILLYRGTKHEYQGSYGGTKDLEFWPRMEAKDGEPFGTSVYYILKYAKNHCL